MIPSFVLSLKSYALTNVTLPPLLMGVVALALGVFVLLRERGSRVGLTFWLFATALSVWLLSLGMGCSALNKPHAVRWIVASNIGLTLVPSFVYLFTLMVVERLRQFRLLMGLSLLVSLAFCAISLSTDWFIRSLERQPWGFNPIYGPLNAWFSAFLFGMMTVSLRLYWVEYRRASPGAQKQRFEGFVLAFCVAYLGSFDYFSAFRASASVYPFGYLPIFVFLLMASRAVKRYRAIMLTPSFAAGQILETMQGAVVVTDLNGIIRVVNRATCALLECREPALLGKPLSTIMSATALEGGLASARLVKAGAVRDREVFWYARESRPIEMSVSASLLKNRSDSAAGIVYVGVDITERKEAEAARLQSQEELRSANKRLVELGRIKDEFLAKVSHDLRTPLTAINEGISLMLEGALGGVNDEQRDFLAMVDQNLARLTELIGNMLDLSKVEAGRLAMVPARVALRPLIETTVKNYQTITGRRTVTVECDGVPDVFADPNRLLQVLGNLFSNAVKFTREDGRITFAAKPRNGQVAVSVRDDGEGIAKDDLPKLFQKFSQVGPESARLKGTGLGLVLCKELVEMHQGTISVSSEPGAGTTFTFTLPIYAPQPADEEAKTSPHANGGGTP